MTMPYVGSEAGPPIKLQVKIPKCAHVETRGQASSPLSTYISRVTHDCYSAQVLVDAEDQNSGSLPNDQAISLSLGHKVFSIWIFFKGLLHYCMGFA